jgi:RimJ/RimL family protein N-acetyltransferase
LIDVDNLASIRVAHKCGYDVFERTLFNDRPTLFLERLGAA